MNEATFDIFHLKIYEKEAKTARRKQGHKNNEISPELPNPADFAHVSF